MDLRSFAVRLPRQLLREDRDANHHDNPDAEREQRAIVSSNDLDSHLT